MATGLLLIFVGVTGENGSQSKHRAIHPDGYGYSRFCMELRDWLTHSE
jgi:hypothetical protein